jgi:hypothetical protein
MNFLIKNILKEITDEGEYHFSLHPLSHPPCSNIINKNKSFLSLFFVYEMSFRKDDQTQNACITFLFLMTHLLACFYQSMDIFILKKKHPRQICFY